MLKVGVINGHNGGYTTDCRGAARASGVRDVSGAQPLGAVRQGRGRGDVFFFFLCLQTLGRLGALATSHSSFFFVSLLCVSMGHVRIA